MNLFSKYICTVTVLHVFDSKINFVNDTTYLKGEKRVWLYKKISQIQVQNSFKASTRNDLPVRWSGFVVLFAAAFSFGCGRAFSFAASPATCTLRIGSLLIFGTILQNFQLLFLLSDDFLQNSDFLLFLRRLDITRDKYLQKILYKSLG